MINLAKKTFQLSANLFNYGAVYYLGCPNDTKSIGAWNNPFVNQGEGQSL